MPQGRDWRTGLIPLEISRSVAAAAVPSERKSGSRTGLTLIETLVATGLFALIAYAIYGSFANIVDISTNSKLIASATAAMQSQVEIIRNMPFTDVGIVGGWPVGKLPASTSTVYDGTPFLLSFTVRNIDDPFDGTLGGAPNDTAPADYRLVSITASCPTCAAYFRPVTLTARVAPAGLETSSTNGSFFVNVFDASGAPLSGANVTVINSTTMPTLLVNDTTNSDGLLQLVDVPTSTSGYRAFVTKSGYSSDRSYTVGDAANPNPIRPHATVASGQLTQISFAIDRLSSVDIALRDEFCTSLSGVLVNATGSKLVGTAPDIVKTTATSTSNASGTASFSLEWDIYGLGLGGSPYDMSGYSTLGFSLDVAPGIATTTVWNLALRDQSALLVTVVDQGGQRLNEATTTLTRTGFSQSRRTGLFSFGQTNWSASGTSGYSSHSGMIDVGVAGEFALLRNASGTYTTGVEDWLVSNTFDVGTSTTVFYRLVWAPTTQPPSVGADSVKFQIAANNDQSTWNFVGPDGLGTSFFTTPGQAITGVNGNRYVRYRTYLKTADENVSPTVTDVTIVLRSECVATGQSYHNGLVPDTYTLTVERGAFQTTSTSVTVGSGWQEVTIPLTPF